MTRLQHICCRVYFWFFVPRCRFRGIVSAMSIVQYRMMDGVAVKEHVNASNHGEHSEHLQGICVHTFVLQRFEVSPGVERWLAFGLDDCGQFNDAYSVQRIAGHEFYGPIVLYSWCEEPAGGGGVWPVSVTDEDVLNCGSYIDAILFNY